MWFSPFNTFRAKTLLLFDKRPKWVFQLLFFKSEVYFVNRKTSNSVQKRFFYRLPSSRLTKKIKIIYRNQNINIYHFSNQKKGREKKVIDKKKENMWSFLATYKSMVSLSKQEDKSVVLWRKSYENMITRFLALLLSVAVLSFIPSSSSISPSFWFGVSHSFSYHDINWLIT